MMLSNIYVSLDRHRQALKRSFDQMENEQIKIKGSYIYSCYAFAVNLHKSKNDPAGALYNAIENFVNENKIIFLTKKGNFRKYNKKAKMILNKFIKEFKQWH